MGLLPVKPAEALLSFTGSDNLESARAQAQNENALTQGQGVLHFNPGNDPAKSAGLEERQPTRRALVHRRKIKKGRDDARPF